MQLRENLYTRTGWEIEEQRFDAEQLVTNGSNYMVGNGYLGYRGTFPEWTRSEYVGCTVSDTYDSADGTWKELCTVPNGLYLQATIGGRRLSVFEGSLEAYRRSLDFRYGVHSRTLRWIAPEESDAVCAEVSDRRFASYDNLHLLVARYEVQSAHPIQIRLGIDGEVWSLNGEHFSSYSARAHQDCLVVETVTGEYGVSVVVAHACRLVGGPRPASEEVRLEERSAYRDLAFERSDQPLELEYYMSVYSSNDVADPAAAAAEAARAAMRSGYQELYQRHCAVWDQKWARSAVQIEGDATAETLLRYNTYHNLIATPAHTDHLPIGARGLSCQAYQGAAFWDQEIFNLPMFLFTDPTVARRILVYRHRTLDGARKKARDLGYRGAFYAWVSGDSGEEICPSYFFVDVLSGRKIRNHFNDWQIHISPDIAFTVWRYYAVTEDLQFMLEYGAEMVFEIARFLVSHAYFKRDKNRFEFIRLLGPDEYHENVDNNAFTNYMARHAIWVALRTWEMLEEQHPQRLEELVRAIGMNSDEVDEWRAMHKLIYIKPVDPQTGLIEQFDGFFQLEDILPGDLQQRLIDPGEYWGWPNGIAVPTQVAKQADVAQLFMLHPDAYDTATMRANYDYYEPRTQHGSSLSPSVYAVVAAWLGYSQKAYDFFIRSATVDLFNTNKAVSGGTFIGGIHTAACGVAWQIVVMGFADMRLVNDELRFSPRMPQHWQTVRFYVELRGAKLSVAITPNSLTLNSEASSQASVACAVFESRVQVAPGTTHTLRFDEPAGR